MRLSVCGIVLLVVLCGFATPLVAAPAWELNQAYRLPLIVDPAGHARFDFPAETVIDFTAVLKAAGATGSVNMDSLRVVEINRQGEVVRRSVPFQFDVREKQVDQGTLIFQVWGETPADQRRFFFLYFDTGGTYTPVKVLPQVRTTDNVAHKGQMAIEIDTPAGRWFYQKYGAAFATLLDGRGNDWIGFQPGDAKAQRRGIPNLVQAEGYFRPGTKRCYSKITNQGPLRTSILSWSQDSKWIVAWGIYPRFARAAVMRAGGPFWFGYEGTPGGTLDNGAANGDFFVRSDGTTTPAQTKVAGDLADPEWAYFADVRAGRSLFLVHYDDDEHPDDYQAIDGATASLVFGRRDLKPHLEKVPGSFMVGLCNETRYDKVKEIVNAMYQPVTVTHGQVQSSAAHRLAILSQQKDAGSWPHWRGPNRNDIVTEDSEHAGWPPEKVAWETKVGLGSTSPIVVGGRVYVLGWADGTDTLYCLDAATGKEHWKTSYPCPKYGRHAIGDEGLYAGVTPTPEFDPTSGYLYTLSVDGDLNCYDTTAVGRKIWDVNLYKTYGMLRRATIGRSGQRDYGYTSSPMVYGNLLLVEVGSPEGTLMAFDKATGERKWASQAKDQAGHTGGPVRIDVEGVPCVALLSLTNLLIIRLDEGHEGETLATVPWATEYANNIVTPSVHGSSVLLSAGYNQKATCRIDVALAGATNVWKQPYYSKVCTPIIHRGHIYAASRRVFCMDFATGELKWASESPTGDAGSCILTSDSRLIIWANKGDLVLAESAVRSPDKYTEVSRRSSIFTADVWPHVVLVDGRLFCKDRMGNMKVFALEAKPEEAAATEPVAEPPPTAEPAVEPSNEPADAAAPDPAAPASATNPPAAPGTATPN